MDYEDPTQAKSKWAAGYTEKDDLNNDGIIDGIERDIKIMGMKEDIKEIVDDKVK